MKIGVNYSVGYKQPAFRAVNQKYLKWAEKDYKLVKDVSSELLESLRYDVCLFKDISPKDGVDTMNAIRKYSNPASKEAFDHVLDNIANA